MQKVNFTYCHWKDGSVLKRRIDLKLDKMNMIKRTFAVLALCTGFAFNSYSAIYISFSEEGSEAIAAVAEAKMEYSTWDAILKEHVDSDGMVDYKAFKTDKRFQFFLTYLGDQHPDGTWSKDEKMAFWINVYNAFTVKLILDNYPLKSITDLKDPWKQEGIVLKGKKYSLDHIENKILRVEFKEPRIHYAINCASFSCPKLHNEAFTPMKLEEQLNAVAHGFVNDPLRNEIGTRSSKLSPIYDWFKADFDVDGGVIKHINKYSRGAMEKGATITFLEYDWNLNEQK